MLRIFILFITLFGACSGTKHLADATKISLGTTGQGLRYLKFYYMASADGNTSEVEDVILNGIKIPIEFKQLDGMIQYSSVLMLEVKSNTIENPEKEKHPKYGNLLGLQEIEVSLVLEGGKRKTFMVVVD